MSTLFFLGASASSDRLPDRNHTVSRSNRTKKKRPASQPASFSAIQRRSVLHDLAVSVGSAGLATTTSAAGDFRQRLGHALQRVLEHLVDPLTGMISSSFFTLSGSP